MNDKIEKYTCVSVIALIIAFCTLIICVAGVLNCSTEEQAKIDIEKEKTKQLELQVQIEQK